MKTKRFLRIAIGAVVAMAGLGIIPNGMVSTQVARADAQIDAASAQVVAIVNQERAKQNLPALKINPKLVEAAQVHSADMAKNNFMSHTGSDGSNVSTRVNRTGYLWRAIAENVAAGQSTPEAVMKSWMNSSGHRANILNANYTEIGVALATNPNARYKYYWTMVLARPR